LFEGDNPVRSVKLLNEPKTKVRFLEPKEEHRLLKAAAPPLASLIVICLDTGLRLALEALTLKWEHVDLKRGLLSVAGTYAKSWELRTVPLSNAAKAALTTLQAARTGEFVFTKRNGEVYTSMREAFDGARDRAPGCPM